MKKSILALLIFIMAAVLFSLLPRAAELPKLGMIRNPPQLNTAEGQPFSFSTEKPKVVAFFYTQCPDVCPMTVMDLKKLQEKLHEKGVKETEYEVIFITLNPAVDSGETIEQYKKRFEITETNWHFLTGTIEQTEEIAKQFNMAFQKDTNGFIIHSTKMYVVDSKNQIRAHHDMNTGQQSVVLNQLAVNIHSLIR